MEFELDSELELYEQAAAESTSAAPTRSLKREVDALTRSRAKDLSQPSIIPNCWLQQFTCVNPTEIRRKAAEQPFEAALCCQEAVRLNSKGHQDRVRAYIATAYAIALEFRGKENQIYFLSLKVCDQRIKGDVPTSKIEENLLHYTFMFIFAGSGMTTRNRATQYANALQYSFDRGEDADSVTTKVVRFGPEWLYRASLKRKESANTKIESQECRADLVDMTDEDLIELLMEQKSGKTRTLIDEADSGPPHTPNWNEVDLVSYSNIEEDRFSGDLNREAQEFIKSSKILGRDTHRLTARSVMMDALGLAQKLGKRNPKKATRIVEKAVVVCEALLQMHELARSTQR